MRIVRTLLVACGVLLIVWGAYEMQQTVSVKHIGGLLLWLLLGLIVSDGIISPAVFAATVLLRRLGRRVPVSVLVIVQSAVVVGLVLTIVVFPEIIKRSIGRANPTVLPFDYGMRLVVMWLILIVATGIAVAVVLVLRRRSTPRLDA